MEKLKHILEKEIIHNYIKVKCVSCDGTGYTKEEYPVRCFTCCGDGYITEFEERDYFLEFMIHKSRKGVNPCLVEEDKKRF